jgi:arsenite-transporting ATPase
VVLVTRPTQGAIAEAARTSVELRELGLGNQRLVINGVFHATDRSDAVARAIEGLGQHGAAADAGRLRELPQDRMPLRAFDTVGLPALRALLSESAPMRRHVQPQDKPERPCCPASVRWRTNWRPAGAG